VATTVELAMKQTANMHLCNAEDMGYDQSWVCEFIDGDPKMLRCTVEIEGHRLYVEAFDVEE
jgi:hypothetical protein